MSFSEQIICLEKITPQLQFFEKITFPIFPNGVNYVKIPEKYEIDIFQKYVAVVIFFPSRLFFSEFFDSCDLFSIFNHF